MENYHWGDLLHGDMTTEDINRMSRSITSTSKDLVVEYRTKENKMKLGSLALELVTMQALHEANTARFREVLRSIDEIKNHEMYLFRNNISGGMDGCDHYWGYSDGSYLDMPIWTRYQCSRCNATVRMEKEL